MNITSKARALLLRSVKSHPAIYQFLRYQLYARFRSIKRKHIFQQIYESNYWGNDFSLSGPGSSLESTENLREGLPRLVAALGARSLLDIPCGDFQWMRHVSLGVERYYGADIVLSLVKQNQIAFGERGEFQQLDLLRDPLPSVDILFCRDCLIHLSFREIQLAIKNVRKAAPKYFLTSTYPDHKVNADTVSPYWRPINLERPPFNFPPPLHLIKDFSDWQEDQWGKYLGAWRMQDLGLDHSTTGSAKIEQATFRSSNG